MSVRQCAADPVNDFLGGFDLALLAVQFAIAHVGGRYLCAKLHVFGDGNADLGCEFVHDADRLFAFRK